MFLITFFSSGNPTKATRVDPPVSGVDIRVRDIRTDRLPGSYQITLTITLD